MYQTMSYEAQLEMKAEQMKEIIEGALASGHSFVFEGIKASPKEFGYRNKMELAMNTKTDRFLLDFIKKEAPTTF